MNSFLKIKNHLIGVVFVSNHQKTRYLSFNPNLNSSNIYVIENALDLPENKILKKDTKTIKIIYHTTPHRGLELVIPIFNELCKKHNNIELHLYSSFNVYGWKNGDLKYKKLFDQCENNKNIFNHGAVSNKEILQKLDDMHIFLYPSIWEETSCLALMEAIKKGLICVHNNFGSLPETSGRLTHMYDYSENKSINATRCYRIIEPILNDFENIYSSHIDYMNFIDQNNSLFDINKYKYKWCNVINEVCIKNEQK